MRTANTTAVIIAVFTATFVSTAAMGRQWTDVSGQYRVEAEIVAVSEHTVVLKKKDGSVIAVPTDQLSQNDQEYLAQQRSDTPAIPTPDPVTPYYKWALLDGFKLNARVLSYGQDTITLQDRNNQILVNDQNLGELDSTHRGLILRLAEKYIGRKFATPAELQSWLAQQNSQPHSMAVQGVLMQLESGAKIPLPFDFFGDAERAFLAAGSGQYFSEETSTDYRSREDFLLRTAADMYQQDRMVARRIQLMQLNLQAVNAGLTHVWEVALLPGPGIYAHPIVAVVSAPNSEAAAVIAMRNNPGYVADAVAKASF